MKGHKIKSVLLEQCFQVVQKRFGRIKQTIADIETSLHEESKSSAGDKHETARAMLQIDRENAGKQLQEIEKVQQLLKKIDISSESNYVRLGSLVYTDKAVYFIGISIGDVEIDNTHYLCVALNSPIGLALSGKKKGDVCTFNEKQFTILQIA